MGGFSHLLASVVCASFALTQVGYAEQSPKQSVEQSLEQPAPSAAAEGKESAEVNTTDAKPSLRSTQAETSRVEGEEQISSGVRELAGQIVLGTAGALILLGLAVLIFSLRGAGGLVLRRYWGGFGGDSSGWSVSAALTRFVAGLVLVSLGAFLTLAVMNPGVQQAAVAQSEHSPDKQQPKADEKENNDAEQESGEEFAVNTRNR
jgi:hypothetical protein